MTNIDQLSVNTIRVLSAEAVQKANSGHPGLPIGAAPMAYTLWAKHLKHNPKNPKWDDRDRFVLSAGHGSMLQYSLLHLFNYGLPMEEIKQFRQWGSKTPGHPEYRDTVGVETTSGPLGQGISMAVGMAIAETHLAEKFNKPGYKVVDHHTYALSGDGCLQEGVSGEASSLAGTLGLGKLIVLYDKNDITIEGSIDNTFEEDVKMRYEAYGWQVLEVKDGNTDFGGISRAIKKAKKEENKPTLIIVNTTIGFATPLAGSADTHGAPLGQENIDAMKKELGWEYDEAFFVPDEVKKHMEKLNKESQREEDSWNKLFDEYAAEYPEMAKTYKEYHAPISADNFDDAYWSDLGDDTIATRASSGKILNRVAKFVPNLMGGSADLAPSNNSRMDDRGIYGKENRMGTNMQFGIREFAMACICNGMLLHGGIQPYCATFLVFSDYMKSAIRMSALMKLPVTYIFTHDSISVGEDGPTHEPIEHLTMLRSIPNLYTWRPADTKETAAAYQFAMTADKPNALALTRHSLPQQENSGKAALKGGYVLKDTEGTPDVILIATGSEVSLAMDSAEKLAEEDIAARVVSMPCVTLYEEQDDDYKESVLPKDVRKRVAIEAGSSFGWGQYVGLDGATVTIDHYGASAPGDVLFEKFGFTTDNVVKTVKEIL